MTSRETFKGFEFARVGEFYLSDTPLEFISGGKQRCWKKPTAFKPIKEDLLNAECSAYLVTIGQGLAASNILYVGEYTRSLKERWFKVPKDGNDIISWHSNNLDDNLNLLLKKLAGIPSDKKWVTTKSNVHRCNDITMNHIIDKTLTENKNPRVALWLTTNPYLINPLDGKKINISQSIENIFLDDTALLLPFNSKGRAAALKDTKPVSQILG